MTLSEKPEENPQPQSLAEALIATLAQQSPQTLIYCSQSPLPVIDALTEQGIEITYISSIGELETLGRYDLGLVFDYLEHLPADDGRLLLGRLRNLHCQQLWVAIEQSGDWDLTAMVSLGFTRQYDFLRVDTIVSAYGYDIDSYNHQRPWNNAKHWANPENWGKYWW